MDPQIAWTKMLDAFESGDWNGAHEFAQHLFSWLAKGGFPPVVFENRTMNDDWNRIVARFCCRLVSGLAKRDSKIFDGQGSPE